MKKRSEHAEQAAFFQYVRLKAFTDRRYRRIWAVPNAGKRSFGAARFMKDEGLTAGVPDITIAIAAGPYHGMFIEMKLPSNKPTPEQAHMIEELNTGGYLPVVCYSAAQAINALESYLLLGNYADFCPGSAKQTKPAKEGPDLRD